MRGVSLYLTLMIMSALLTAVLGVSSVLLSQIKVISQQGNSVAAFFAAETGIERELYEKNPVGTPSYSGSVGSASYTVEIVSFSEINSRGEYKGTRRAIQVTR